MDTPCISLHVKKRFPKRKIKAWIVQTLLACYKHFTKRKINFLSASHFPAFITTTIQE